MNTSRYLCSRLIRLTGDKKPLLSSASSHALPRLSAAQTQTIVRTVIARPKELDQLRKVNKNRQQDGKDKYSDKSTDDEAITPLGYFLLSIPVITFGLGTWQVRRREWKIKLIKDLEERLAREPVPLPENLDDLEKLEYCPIKVRGQFLYDNEFVVGPRSLLVNGKATSEGKGQLISSSGANRGYNVITPFKLEDRDLVILVNRGWLPNKYKHAEERTKCRMEGTVEFTGINRLNEVRPQFVPKNEPDKGMWHYRDVYQMAEFAKTEPIYLDMVESDLEPNMPIGGQTRVNIRNEHLSYIATWYGLSLITGFYCYRMFVLKKPIM
ncbi:hypothetical protein TKK_0003455 [Trichogramma kaykai]|uniref:SURF1-like protein n=1 Tax=Trichogramma kaykai TaxID=54128 RepID=A0ABD2XQ30_9HYME